MSRANLHRGYCFTCGAEDVGDRHVCPDPMVLNPQPPPGPFVKRWDPVGGLWVHCRIEKGKAWCFEARAYTEVRRGELTTSNVPGVSPVEVKP